MSCNTFIPIMDLVREVEALLAANYIDKDDPRITGGVFTNPTIAKGFLLDVDARLEFCRLVQECGLDAPFGKMWLARPLSPGGMLISYEESGQPLVKWASIQTTMEQAGILGDAPTSLASRLAVIDGKLTTNIADTSSNTAAIGAEVIRAEGVESALATDISALKSTDIVLQEQVNSIGGGKKGYVTYAEMEAEKLNIPVNSSVDVVADPDPAKNGTYAYNGTTFTKSPYDPLTLAKADATTKANTAKSEAIFASETDATAKATAAKLEAINAAVVYTDEKISKIDISTPVLTGQQLYNKALRNPMQLFSAIWSEYNKPVWHTGAGKFVDAVGASIKPVVEELVFTIKTIEDNQKYYFPAFDLVAGAPVATVDWGDGTTGDVRLYHTTHIYSAPAGTTFTIKMQGNMPALSFSGPSLVSIDKNTMPKIMPRLSFNGTTNLVSIAAGGLSSYAGTTGAFLFEKNAPNLVLSKDMFLGLGQLTDIESIIADIANPFTKTIPAGLFDYFTNVTNAKRLFYMMPAGMTLPMGILDKMVSLENVFEMFAFTKIASVDSNMFKYQTKLKDVTRCFHLCAATADANILYNDMKRGNPTLVSQAFNAPNMTNKTSVPAEWK